MTHREKWERIEEIDRRLVVVTAERDRLMREKNDLLVTVVSDSTTSSPVNPMGMPSSQP